MPSTEIRREIESFQQSVKTLSDGIRQSGATWNDEKHKNLSKLIRDIASSSKQVIVSGDKVCELVDRFEQIASEDC